MIHQCSFITRAVRLEARASRSLGAQWTWERGHPARKGRWTWERGRPDRVGSQG